MLLLESHAVNAVDLLVQPLRKLAHSKRQVLAAELVLVTIGRASIVAAQESISQPAPPVMYLHMKLATEALFDDHATDSPIEVAEDVGEVGAPGVAWNHGRVTLTLGLCEDDGTLAFGGGAYDRLFAH